MPLPNADDPVARFLALPTVRLWVRLGAFALVLWGLRALLPTLAAFAFTCRGLDATAVPVGRRLGGGRLRGVLAVAAASVVSVGLALWFGGATLFAALAEVERDLPVLLETASANPLFVTVRGWLGDVDLAATGWETARELAFVVQTVGQLFLQSVVGFGLALFYEVERDEVDRMVAGLAPDGLGGTLLRWGDHVGDGLAITLQVQLAVAACNAALTLPLVLVLGLPYPATLFAVIFLLALIPLFGNFISGALLMALAWPTWGGVGVVAFSLLVFVLGKIESFVLNPRLAARHVRLPGFVLTVSLVLWEHVAGVVGFFLSFPFLYTFARIRQEVVGDVAAWLAAEPPAPPEEVP
ncbi:MAG: hypothetical protein RLZZ383_778 [Pseudomonadota bacterium]|jgi:predicted PurR-regulated permease PerM